MNEFNFFEELIQSTLPDGYVVRHWGGSPSPFFDLWREEGILTGMPVGTADISRGEIRVELSEAVTASGHWKQEAFQLADPNLDLKQQLKDFFAQLHDL